MLILDCKSESGDNYCFKASKVPTKEEFDEFVKNNYPEEMVSGYNCLEIEAVYDLDDIEQIN